MNNKTRTRLIKSGNYLAEVQVELLYDIEPWSPHLSADDAFKLDRVRAALGKGDLKAAARDAVIYEVVPCAASGTA